MPVYKSEDFDLGSSGQRVTTARLENFQEVGTWYSSYMANSENFRLYSFNSATSISSPNSVLVNTKAINDYFSANPLDGDGEEYSNNATTIRNYLSIGLPAFYHQEEEYIPGVPHISFYFCPLEYHYDLEPSDLIPTYGVQIMNTTRNGGFFDASYVQNRLTFDENNIYFLQTYVTEDRTESYTDVLCQTPYSPGSWYRFDIVFTFVYGNYGIFGGENLHNPDMQSALAGSKDLPEVTLPELWGFTIGDGPFDITQEEWEEIYNAAPEEWDAHPLVDYHFRYWPNTIRDGYSYTEPYYEIPSSMYYYPLTSLRLGNDFWPPRFWRDNLDNKVSYLFDRFRADTEPIIYPDFIPDVTGWYIGRIPQKGFVGGSGGGGGGGGSW